MQPHVNFNSPVRLVASLQKVQGNIISVSAVSPEVAVASGNKNGGNGITKNTVGGNQEQKQSLETYQNNENSQSGGGGGGLLGGLLSK